MRNVSLLLLALILPVRAEEPVTFNRHIRPILSDRCYKCHGPDENTREAGLRLDTAEGAYAALKGEPVRHAIKPRDPRKSEVFYRLTTTDPDDRMPPADLEMTVSPAEITLIRKWIEQGASYENHWSFNPIQRPPPPTGETTGSIDAFIASRHRDHGLSFSPPADKRALLKRLAFDLTGLPPSREEIDRFLSDEKPGAYEKLVDRLLASPRYGEHMALSWMEAARYADTSGYQADWERFMWPWREWVIQAYNQNMPFDRFTLEQLAGDLLPNPTRGQLVATGFNRNHRINDEGGVIAAEYAVEYVVDRIDTTSTVWLGLTMGCARCHDHKYDPISQTDFYQLFAFFNNVPEKGKDGRKGWSDPAIDYPHPAMQAKLEDLEAKRADWEGRFRQDTPDLVTAREVQIAQWRSQREKAGKPVAWTVWSGASAGSTEGVILKPLEDGSWLATGPNPTHPKYTVRGKLQADRVTGLQLDVLSHPSLAHNRLSRSSNGNLVISELTVAYQPSGSTNPIPVSIVRAEADHHQEKYPPENLLDGREDTGWAPEAQTKKGNRRLVFRFAEPVVNHPDTEWVVTLSHGLKFAAHTTGRFRLSHTDHPEPVLNEKEADLPKGVLAALKTDPPDEEALAGHFRQIHPALKPLREEGAKLDQQIEEMRKKATVKVMVMQEMETPRETFVLSRGQYDQPDKTRKVEPAIPAVFGGLPENAPPNRLGLAQWLVHRDNPLTARVAVNRYWQMLFGRGLVKTPEDFGSQGALPSHPDLLDWLALEFVDSGWDVKAMLKRMVMSRTYRQSSRVTPHLLETDPENQWLARGPRFRLSAYQLRDQALAVSGLLVNQIGGPSVKPYQPAGLWAEVSFQDKKRSTDFFVQDHGEKLYRRSLYTFWKRTVAPPQLASFDAAGREACSVGLVRTSTPLQALTLMNDVTFVEAARGLAARMLLEGGDDPITYGLRLCSVEPRPEVMSILELGLADYRKTFAADPEAAARFVKNGESEAPTELDAQELAAFTAVASVILNLDQVITKE